MRMTLHFPGSSLYSKLKSTLFLPYFLYYKQISIYNPRVWFHPEGGQDALPYLVQQGKNIRDDEGSASPSTDKAA